MRLDEILSYCTYVLAANQRGNSISPGQFNTLLMAVNTEYFDSEVNKLFQMAQVPTPLRKDMLLNNPLSMFTHEDVYSSNNHIRSYTLPQGADRIWSVMAKIGTTQIVPLDIYTEQQLTALRTSVLNVDFEKNPGGIIRGGVLRVIGENVRQLDVAYLTIPATPYYDYCVDSNDNIIYLRTTYQLLPTGVPYYYNIVYDTGTAMAVLYSNVYYSRTIGEVGTLVNPITVELEWQDQFHVVFANKILEKMGISIRDPFVYQTTQVADKKDQQ